MMFFALLVMVLGVLSLVGLVLVGLVEMPWPLLLVGLIAVLYGFQRLLNVNTAVSPVESPSSPSVSASAHGGSDPVTPSPEPVDGLNAPRGDDELIYRGVRYRAKPSAKSQDLSS
ncbi:MAG TPA: hypothetical protein IGR64_12475 [Leptolyngbyaceae cyanobacterium M65_K2018_010]|nr:hypothetical protein [Leptolyngbyaceae cyanobacterium M65_K2018_010]